MSEKDRNTIIIAVIALLIFGIGFLGIKPAFTGIKETKATNAELSAKKTEMETQINSLPSYKVQLETAKAEYAQTVARVYDDLTNDKIHDAVVAFVNKQGLQVTNFSVSDIITGAVSGYTVSEGAGVGGINEGSVQIATVSITVAGSKAQIIALADYMNKTEGIYVESISFGTEGTDNSTAASIQLSMLLGDTIE